jgi:hypothetical protein
VGIGGVLTIALLLLDLVYYRQNFRVSVIVITVISFAVLLLWIVFQRSYFGMETFQKNVELLGQLARATTGISLNGFIRQAKFLIGFKNDYFYFLWGFPAIIYAVILCLRKDERGFLTSVLTIFAVVWLGYYFYSVPWPSYLFVPATMVSLFLGKFWFDLISEAKVSLGEVAEEIKSQNLARAGLFVVLIVGLILSIGYPLQNAIQFNILSKDTTPQLVADWLNQEVDQAATIETWEKELGILTNHHYHYPEQSLLIQVHTAKYRQNSEDYLLSTEYFKSIKPAYVVVGRFAKEFPVYDPGFLATKATLITKIGEDELGSYEIYEINYP